MGLSRFASLAALFALLTTIAAKIIFHNSEIPYTLQSVFVLLSGLVGGPIIGITSMLIYLMFGMFVPVFAGNDFGFSVIADPSAGYLFAFPVAAFIAGYIGHQSKAIWIILLACIAAQTSLYLVGVLILFANTSYNLIESIQIGFLNMALVGYMKSIITGLLYFTWQKINPQS